MKRIIILLFVAFNSYLFSQNKKEIAKTQSIKIDLSFQGLERNDSIIFRFWRHILSKSDAVTLRSPYEELISYNKNGVISFNIPQAKDPIYFSIFSTTSKNANNLLNPLLEFYLVTPGDSVFIQIRQDSFFFTGKGAEKFNCKYSLNKQYALFKMNNINQKVEPDYEKRLLNGWQRKKNIFKEQFEMLKEYKTKIDAASYQVMKADLLSSYLADCNVFLKNAFSIASSKDFKLGAEIIKFKTLDTVSIIRMDTENSAFLKILEGISENILSLSLSFPTFVQTNFEKKNLFFNDETIYYDFIREKFKGRLHDKLVTHYLYDNYGYTKNEHYDSWLKEAINIVKDSAYCKILQNLYDSQKSGTISYNFSLSDFNGNIVRLSDFKGKIVYIDMWFTGCGGCAEFYTSSLSLVEKEFKNNPNLVFVSISVDKEKDKWIKGLNSSKYTSTELANVINLYTDGFGIDHPVVKRNNVKGYPFQMLIDQEGNFLKINGLRLPPEELIKLLKIVLHEG